MLNFFRKHQRFFFIVVTIFVVISFCFFGTFGTMASNAEAPDKTLGSAVDGSALSSREVAAMSRFLSSSAEDSIDMQGRRMPNLLNDGVIQKEFISTGMAVMLAKEYFPLIKEDMESRLKKMKAYRPYVHPQTPYLSAENIWQRFVPAIPQRLAELKLNVRGAEIGTFDLICKLYLDQMMFSPELLKRFLSYQQSQYNWVQPDPELSHGNLGLFGFVNAEDWFGPRYLELISQFVINCALLAKEKGYQVTDDEARADLIQNALRGLQQTNPKQNITYKDADEYFRSQVRILGFDENSAARLWKKVMLFRRFFHDVGSAVFLDPLAHQQFHAYAGESAAIELYQLPQELRLSDFRKMLKFQVYLEAVATRAQKPRALTLPKTFASVDEVEKRCPQLVQRKFQLEIARVDKEKLAAGISLKETWEWELDENHWSTVKEQFPLLAQASAATREQRFLALEALEKEVRFKLDKFAADQILQSRGQFIDEALQQAVAETEVVGIRLQGGKLPFEGVEERETLIELLSGVSDIPKFSADNEHFYRIKVLTAAPKKETLTFAEALQDDTLDELLDKKLEDAYFEVRRKEPITFQLDDGSWKPFQDVKDLIGARLYAELLKAIEDDYRMSGGKVEQPTLGFYAAHRFYHHMRQAKTQLETNPNDAEWLRAEAVSADAFSAQQVLEAQWKLVKSASEVQRSDRTIFSKEELFALSEGAWSSLHAAQNGDVAFYRLEKHLVKEHAMTEKIAEGQECLSIDARRYLMQQVLKLIAEKDGIHLSERAQES